MQAQGIFSFSGRCHVPDIPWQQSLQPFFARLSHLFNTLSSNPDFIFSDPPMGSTTAALLKAIQLD
jgi:hypothetical protein